MEYNYNLPEKINNINNTSNLQTKNFTHQNHNSKSQTHTPARAQENAVKFKTNKYLHRQDH